MADRKGFPLRLDPAVYDALKEAGRLKEEEDPAIVSARRKEKS